MVFRMLWPGSCSIVLCMPRCAVLRGSMRSQPRGMRCLKGFTTRTARCWPATAGSKNDRTAATGCFQPIKACNIAARREAYENDGDHRPLDVPVRLQTYFGSSRACTEAHNRCLHTPRLG